MMKYDHHNVVGAVCKLGGKILHLSSMVLEMQYRVWERREEMAESQKEGKLWNTHMSFLRNADFML